ncbi:hypothetical protein QYF36_026327 [Acer negundo]|nr:hypothetical protein QYF36_026327 [Acer negundo]
MVWNFIVLFPVVEIDQLLQNAADKRVETESSLCEVDLVDFLTLQALVLIKAFPECYSLLSVKYGIER